MSSSWSARRKRLLHLFSIDVDGSEDEKLGLALDEYEPSAAHDHTEVSKTRFGNKDIRSIGVLEAGQFATIDVVKCRLDSSLYIRKAILKDTARRYPQQCFPQTERDILLLAQRTNASFAPHLIASYHSSSSLYLIMQYASGGTLWDVLESSPNGIGIPETDLRWWIPQTVAAIEWCHDQGFCHRDIKPHNFAITSESRVLLIDFGSAAPLLPPASTQDKFQRVPKQYCVAPCGTCDYIAPEVLRHFEQDMILFEAGNSSDGSGNNTSSTIKLEVTGLHESSYGADVDWWSLGAMIYELHYGIAPFFAEDVRKTYLKIVKHQDQLAFDPSIPISADLKSLIEGFLRDSDARIGRNGSQEVKAVKFFHGIQWPELLSQLAPPTLHLPQFTYTDDAQTGLMRSAMTHSRSHSRTVSESFSRPFQFSQFFRSSANSRSAGTPRSGMTADDLALANFLGFTWGPAANAFDGSEERVVDGDLLQGHTPNIQGSQSSFPSHTQVRNTWHPQNSHASAQHPFMTPLRFNSSVIPKTLPHTGTVARTVGRRAMTNREAMDILVQYIGKSAQKKVLESGKKPRSMRRLAVGQDARVVENGATIPLALRFQLGAMDPASDDDDQKVQRRVRPHNAENTDDTESTLLSPSPTPRPSSALSTTMTLTRRSITPTGTLTMTRSGLLSANQTTTHLGALDGTSKPLRHTVSNPGIGKSNTGPSQAGLSFDDDGLILMERRLEKLERDMEKISRGLVALNSKN